MHPIIPDAYATGDYDITAFVSNENGTDVINWDWRLIKPTTLVDITHTGNIEVRSPVYDKNDILALNDNNTFHRNQCFQLCRFLL